MVGWGLLRQVATLQGEAQELGALSEACRTHVLSRAAELLHSAAGCLVIDGDMRGIGQIREAATHNFDGVTRPAFQPLLDHGATFHPLVHRTYAMYQSQPTGILVHANSELFSTRAWRESPYYCDYLRQIGFDDSIMSLRIGGPPALGRGFGFFRERGLPQFDEDDKLLLEIVELSLGPYIHRPPLPPGLSPRDRDVLRLLREGLSDKEIASRLAISRHTVNQRTKRLFRRFGVHSRGELIAKPAHALTGAANGRTPESSGRKGRG
jgi:DNA-binding CsgD family transcriptional regulator